MTNRPMTAKYIFKQASGFLRRSLLFSNQRPYVFILGMHRSGTSCLAGMLKNYGAHLGYVSSRNLHNLKGNQEGYAVSINDGLLKANGGAWFEPVSVSHVPWAAQVRIERLRFQMAYDLMRSGKRRWGVKDPRMLFCWPAWEEKGIRLVGTFRHPLRVARSLEARGGDTGAPTDWMELCYRYNLKLIELYRKQPFPIVNFDWPPERYRQAVRHIARHLDLNLGETDFFDDKLRHQSVEGRIASAKHRELYDQLLEIGEVEERKLMTSHHGEQPV